MRRLLIALAASALALSACGGSTEEQKVQHTAVAFIQAAKDGSPELCDYVDRSADCRKQVGLMAPLFKASLANELPNNWKGRVGSAKVEFFYRGAPVKDGRHALTASLRLDESGSDPLYFHKRGDRWLIVLDQ